MNKKINSCKFIMILASVCLCLVLITMHMMPDLFARYSTTATGSDSARVIKFSTLNITVDNSTSSIFSPGTTMSKAITVNFGGSEAKTYVFAVITASGWTWTRNEKKFTSENNILSWTVADGWNFLKNDKDVYVFYQELAPNAALTTTNIIEENQIHVSSNVSTKEKDYAENNIEFSVMGYAVQANGFNSASAAWDSVSKH